MIITFFGHDALANLFLEHQRHGKPERWPDRRQQPVEKKLCADIIRKVGNDAHGLICRNQRCEIRLQGIALYHLKATGIVV
ncbi:hypothetical protein D3C80_1644230 [compost metagenome]